MSKELKLRDGMRYPRYTEEQKLSKRVTKENVLDMYRLLRAGYSIRETGRRLKLSHTTVIRHTDSAAAGRMAQASKAKEGIWARANVSKHRTHARTTYNRKKALMGPALLAYRRYIRDRARTGEK